jgi:GT2 family glycosyltransferase
MPVPVSVVIPYHNAHATFAEALESVRAQTHAPAEVIVVDDASDVEGRRFLEGFADDLVVIRFPKRRGPGPARNAGVAAATQPYVAFLDADDRWMASKLRVQYRYMEHHPAVDATHTGWVFSYLEGRERAQVNPPERTLSIPHALADFRMSTPSLMMRRSTFLDMGGYDPAFLCTQDWELQIRMALAGLRVEFLPLPLAWIRRQNHGHHSANWRCYLKGHVGILLKHRRSYVTHFGGRQWLHLLARELARGGHKRGGWLGRGLCLPYRLGV